ncbi:hypothetical protein DSECCO2_120410 [anaerobic digester metagenome]
MKSEKTKEITKILIRMMMLLLNFVVNYTIAIVVISIVALPIWGLMYWIIPSELLIINYKIAFFITLGVYLIHDIGEFMHGYSVRITSKLDDSFENEDDEDKITKTAKDYLAKMKDKLRDNGIEVTEDNTDALK